MSRLKSRFKQLLQEARQFFDSMPEGEPKTPSLTEAVLEDGTVLYVEGELAEGSPAFLADEEGNSQPAPDADYTLEDGTVLTVQKGIIIAVKKAEEKPQPKDEKAKPKEEQPAAPKEVAARLRALEKKLDSLEKRLSSSAEFRKDTTSLRQELRDAIANQRRLFQVVAALAESPADRPAERPRNLFSSPSDESEAKHQIIADRIRALQSQING